MPIEMLNPDGLPKPEVYRQMSVATGTRTVYLSGQVARTADGEPVGPGDLAAQTEQAYLNVATALAAVGGTFDDVAKLNVYVVDLAPEKIADFGAGVMRAAERLGIEVAREDFRPIVKTASGVGQAAVVRIERLELGEEEFADVDAMVAEGLEVNLLGQSVLRRLGKVELRGDQMVIEHR